MKKARLKKGSAAAKAFMAKLRSMQGGKRKAPARAAKGRKAAKKRSSFANPRSITQAEFELNKLRNKGRRIAKAAKIKPFFFTGRKPQIVVSEGEFGMARKRKTRRKSASRKATRYSGRTRKYTSRRRTHRRHGSPLMGGMGGTKGIVPMLTQGVIGAAGAIGSAFIASKAPGVPAKMKPAIPFAVAIALLMFEKKIPMAKPLAFGCVVSGAMGLVKQFVPNIPLLAGVDSAPELSTDEMALLGEPQSYGAVQELTGAVSPADI